MGRDDRVDAIDIGPDGRVWVATHDPTTQQLVVDAVSFDDPRASSQTVLSQPLRGDVGALAVGRHGVWLEVASTIGVCNERVMWAPWESERMRAVSAMGCVEGPRSLSRTAEAMWSVRPTVVADDRFVLASGDGAAPVSLGNTHGATIDALAVMDDVIVFGATDGAVVQRTLAGQAGVLMTALPAWHRTIVAVAAHGNEAYVILRRRSEELRLDTPPGHPGAELARFDARFDRVRLWSDRTGVVVHLRDHDRAATEPVRWIDPTGACPPRELVADADLVASRDGVVVVGDREGLTAFRLDPGG